jgi:predicted hydrocarbon binding protein
MKEKSLSSKLLSALMKGIDAEVDRQTRIRVMKHCGQACAVHHGSIAKVEAVRDSAEDLDQLLEQLNQDEDFWCGKWVRDGDTVRTVCKACGCPLVLGEMVDLSPALCDCSLGWVEAVFEVALGRPVKAELVQAIGRGDPVCEFVVLPESK